MTSRSRRPFRTARNSSPCMSRSADKILSDKQQERETSSMTKLILSATLLLAPTAALAHTGHGATASLFAGLAHPLSGLDHLTVMLAVGALAALKGGRALWLWPLTFVG